METVRIEVWDDKKTHKSDNEDIPQITVLLC